MMKLRWSTTVLAVLLWAGFAGTAFGQSTNSADISGIVTDTTGAAVPGTTVTVLNIATGVSKNLVTNDAGVYDTSSIVTGTYKITFSKPGFATLVRSSVTIEVGPTTINEQLAVGGVSQEVVVNTDVPLLKTENGEQTITLSAETLQALPEVGQDWTSFSILLPGAAGAPGGSQGALHKPAAPHQELQSRSTEIFPTARYCQTGRRRLCLPAQTLTSLPRRRSRSFSTAPQRSLRSMA